MGICLLIMLCPEIEKGPVWLAQISLGALGLVTLGASWAFSGAQGCGKLPDMGDIRVDESVYLLLAIIPVTSGFVVVVSLKDTTYLRDIRSFRVNKILFDTQKEPPKFVTLGLVANEFCLCAAKGYDPEKRDKPEEPKG